MFKGRVFVPSLVCEAECAVERLLKVTGQHG